LKGRLVKKLFSTVALIIALTALAACGEAKTDTPTTAAGGTTAAPSALTVDTATGADLKFVPTALEAAAGDVTVTFNNKGALPHNWALVKAGDEDKASTEAMAAAPDYQYSGALAQTKTINGGTSETVTAKLAPGTYTYICTFPGHYAVGMKGTLTVK
jgi:plastocyanin